MRDVLQGERLALRKMRVKALLVAADLAASYSGYTPELKAGPALGWDGAGPCANRRARAKARTL